MVIISFGGTLIDHRPASGQAAYIWRQVRAGQTAEQARDCAVGVRLALLSREGHTIAMLASICLHT